MRQYRIEWDVIIKRSVILEAENTHDAKMRFMLDQYDVKDVKTSDSHISYDELVILLWKDRPLPRRNPKASSP
jgi:hypothetical protein